MTTDYKPVEALESGDDDRLSELPDEILLSIVSCFSTKEIARLSRVSRQWEFIWRCAPILAFEYPRATAMGWGAVPEDIHSFVRWVDGVLDKHSGTAIDELRITFIADLNWQSQVDKWAAFAVDKHVKRLDLNLTTYIRKVEYTRKYGYYKRSEPVDLPPKLSTIKSSRLTCLRLKCVNVTDDFIDHLSHSCPLLEVLSIEESDRLTSVQVCASFKQLKHLEVSYCHKLKNMDITAPKLSSFTFYNSPVDLRFSHAPSLVDVSVGTEFGPHSIAYVFDSLSKYFSQLVRLSLVISMCGQKNLGIDNPADMPNLRHLEFQVIASLVQSLRGWAPLIAASPRLQKLSLKLGGSSSIRYHPFVRTWTGFPLKCLKTLELGGYIGQILDLELAFFVFENATMLEEVIVDFIPLWYLDAPETSVEERLARLQMKLPKAVKLTIK